MKTCFFIGHHDAPSTLQQRLNQVVENLVRYEDVTTFLVDHRGNFDEMATKAVQEAIKFRPELYAYSLIAYHPFEQNVTIPDFFESTYYPEGLEDVPKRFAITKANQIALMESDIMVAYVKREGSAIAKLLGTAKRLEKKGVSGSSIWLWIRASPKSAAIASPAWQIPTPRGSGDNPRSSW